MVSGETLLNYWFGEFEEQFARTGNYVYARDSKFHEACRYAIHGQGKRIRPLLLFATHHACFRLADVSKTFHPALAIEFIHTYSLVHDDLPCMDDDDMRRGRPTVHKAFDEATALLVGDALLNDAFTFLSIAPQFDAQQKLDMIQCLSVAAGGQGMVLGQSLDLSWTGKSGYELEDLEAVHLHKTARLIEAACEMGAISAGAKSTDRVHAANFGKKIGLAFQIIDDLLDDRETTGKTAGKDKAAGKLTYLTVMSADEASLRAKTLTDEALDSLAELPGDTRPLKVLAGRLLQRVL